MYTALVVRGQNGKTEESQVRIPWASESRQTQVKYAQSVEEAGGLFNGKAGAEILVIGAVPGARKFVLDIRRRFPKVQVIGLAENRKELCDCGCSCIVGWDRLPFTVPALLEKAWRFR